MKKTLTLFMAFVMTLSLCACGKTVSTSEDTAESITSVKEVSSVSKENETTSTTTSTSMEEPVKEEQEDVLKVNVNEIPAEYAASVTISINPKITLYINEDTVIAWTFDNDDAKEAYEGIDLLNVKPDEAIKTVIDTAIEKEYLKEDGKVSLSVSGEKAKDLSETYQKTVAEILTNDKIVATVSAEYTDGDKKIALEDEVVKEEKQVVKEDSKQTTSAKKDDSKKNDSKKDSTSTKKDTTSSKTESSAKTETNTSTETSTSTSSTPTPQEQPKADVSPLTGKTYPYEYDKWVYDGIGTSYHKEKVTITCYNQEISDLWCMEGGHMHRYDWDGHWYDTVVRETTYSYYGDMNECRFVDIIEHRSNGHIKCNDCGGISNYLSEDVSVDSWNETYKGVVLNEEGYNNARQSAIAEYWYNHPADVSGNPTGTDAEAEAFADSQVNRSNYEILKPISPSQPGEWVRD